MTLKVNDLRNADRTLQGVVAACRAYDPEIETLHVVFRHEAFTAMAKGDGRAQHVVSGDSFEDAVMGLLHEISGTEEAPF